MKPELSVIPAPDHSTEDRAVSQVMKDRVRREQGGICARSWCEAPGVDVDHIMPLWNYGKNTRDNLEALCITCHAQKTKAEAAMRAKAKAQGGETGQKARRDRRGGSSIRSGAKLQSGGFGGGPSKRQQRLAARQQEVTEETDSDDGNEGACAVVTPESRAA